MPTSAAAADAPKKSTNDTTKKIAPSSPSLTPPPSGAGKGSGGGAVLRRLGNPLSRRRSKSATNSDADEVVDSESEAIRDDHRLSSARTQLERFLEQWQAHTIKKKAAERGAVVGDVDDDAVLPMEADPLPSAASGS